MKNEPLISIMILGWNNYSDLINCLRSLREISYRNYNIVLVDNGSRKTELDKFFWYLKKSRVDYAILDKDLAKNSKVLKSAGKVFIVLNEKNLGFTSGSNLGLEFTLKICDPEYLLLLNGDTIVTKDFLENLVSACEKDQKIAAAQSALIRFDRKTIDSLGIEMKDDRAFDSQIGRNRKILESIEEVREIFGACGASALYRASLIKKIGLFDDDLFATYEDFDLAWRIRLNGFKSVLVKNSIVYHRGGVSRKRGDHVIFDFRSYLGSKNALVMFNRYYPFTFKVITSSIVKIGVALISAFKNHRMGELIKIFYSFPKDRRATSKNSRLKEVQKKWIK